MFRLFQLGKRQKFSLSPTLMQIRSEEFEELGWGNYELPISLTQKKGLISSFFMTEDSLTT